MFGFHLLPIVYNYSYSINSLGWQLTAVSEINFTPTKTSSNLLWLFCLGPPVGLVGVLPDFFGHPSNVLVLVRTRRGTSIFNGLLKRGENLLEKQTEDRKDGGPLIFINVCI